MTDVLEYYNNEGFYREGVHIVTVKVFYFESKARLYEARLKEVGIPCFVSNANTVNVMPLGEGGIRLHVRATDLEAATAVVEELDTLNVTDGSVFTHHDADHEDIAWEKMVNSKDGKNTTSDTSPMLIAIIVVLIVCLLVFYYMR